MDARLTCRCCTICVRCDEICSLRWKRHGAMHYASLLSSCSMQHAACKHTYHICLYEYVQFRFTIKLLHVNATGFLCHYHRIVGTSTLFSLPHLSSHHITSHYSQSPCRVSSADKICNENCRRHTHNERKWKLKPQPEMTHMKSIIAQTVI